MKLNELKNFSDKELISIGEKCGRQLYGDRLVFTPTVSHKSFEEYVNNGDDTVDTFSYVFFPSKAIGLESSDKKLSKKHVSDDGKIYLAGADGVIVLSDPFKIKSAIKIDENLYQTWIRALEKLHPGAKVGAHWDRWHRKDAKLNGKLVGTYYANLESHLKSSPPNKMNNGFQINGSSIGGDDGLYTWTKDYSSKLKNLLGR